MADGSSSLRHVRVITETVLRLHPRSVLDLGMGTGKYGFLLREQHDLAQTHWGQEPWRLRLVGVEGFPGYITDIQAAVYDEVVAALAHPYLKGCRDQEFDVALALDLIEHFTPEDGVVFLDEALRAATTVVVLTPAGFYRQDGHANTLERHLSWWPRATLRDVGRHLGASVASTTDGGAVIAVMSRHGLTPLPKIDNWTQAIRNGVHSTLPERAWCRLRGKSGPVAHHASAPAS